MPSIDQDFLKQLHGDYTQYTQFVETGTYNGNTTFTMEPLFSHVYTIELSEFYHNNTKKQYNGDKISFLLGDSSVVLESLVPTINEPTIFFLDGHWSCEDTAQGVKDCPLYEEITHINTLFRPNAIIIIDDVRLFGSNTDVNWSDINKDTIVKLLGSRVTEVYDMPSSFSPTDRMIIHIGPLA
jgi:hypothetical protein